MATNKRDLKKEIRYICGDLAGECIMMRELMPDVDAETANNLVIEIAGLQVSTLRKVSFSFDKAACDFENAQAYRKAKHAYYASAYKKLAEEFNAGVAAVLKKMNAQLTAEQREANKKALA